MPERSPLMRLFAVALFLICATAAPSGSAPAKGNLVEECLREAGESKRAGDLSGTEKKLAACSASAPGDPRIRTERADNLVRLGRYEEAVAQYLRAATLHYEPRLAAACHRKAAQVYLKMDDARKAADHYVKALALHESDSEAAFGLAAMYDSSHDLRKAAEFYARGLKYDPANAKAGERLDEIRFSLLTSSQLLEELRYRGAGYGKKTVPDGEDLLMLNTMRLAERRGAVDHLHSKVRNLDGLAVERLESGRVRLMLTPAGLKAYQNFLSRDAMLFFEKNGVPLGEVFSLRDLSGRPIFDKNGRLTLEGMKAYWAGTAGSKSWLLRYEAVVKTPEDEKFNSQVRELLGRSYIEVSEVEYLWLLKVTTCNEEVLQDPSTCKMKMLRSPTARKYFLFRQDSDPGCNLALNSYIEDYRAGSTDVSGTTHGTSFFGSGGNEKHRLCEKGKLW